MLTKKSQIRIGDLVRVKPTWSIDYMRQVNTDLEGKVGVVTEIIPTLTPSGTDDYDPLNDIYVILINGNNITFHGIRFLEKVINARSQ